MLISLVHPGHFIYIILEDALLLPRIQAIFTSRGQATCYHPNGLVWYDAASVLLSLTVCAVYYDVLNGSSCTKGLIVSGSSIYHGVVCLLVCSVNLSRLGGIWCTESGALKRRWSWLDLSTHVHAPPFQPIAMTLSPSISVRICTQDRVYLTFTAGKNTVRFNVGTRLKVSYWDPVS